MANLDLEIHQLNQLRDGFKVYKQIEKLSKKATVGSARLFVVQALLDYAEKGSFVAHRSSALDAAIPFLDANDTAFESILYRLLERNETTYWSMDALMKVLGRDCYPVLAKFALNGRNDLDDRAKAFEVLCQHAHLPWIEKLPDDPGEWLSKDLPLKELRDWIKQGYSITTRIPQVKCHPDLLRPKTELDRTAQALEAVLAIQLANQRERSPTQGRLLPSSPATIETLLQRWKLPSIYVRFLKKYSPNSVLISMKRQVEDLQLFGAAELELAQDGYSHNSIKNEVIDIWPTHYVVIAEMAGDPFVLDLSAAKKGDAPVLTAKHGQGAWKFRKFADTFLEFLQKKMTQV
jgi:SMI1 / KNR4 family (SUKH-1)